MMRFWVSIGTAFTVFCYHYKDRKDTMATIQDQKHQPSLHLSKHQD